MSRHHEFWKRNLIFWGRPPPQSVDVNHGNPTNHAVHGQPLPSILHRSLSAFHLSWVQCEFLGFEPHPRDRKLPWVVGRWWFWIVQNSPLTIPDSHLLCARCTTILSNKKTVLLGLLPTWQLPLWSRRVFASCSVLRNRLQPDLKQLQQLDCTDCSDGTDKSWLNAIGCSGQQDSTRLEHHGPFDPCCLHNLLSHEMQNLTGAASSISESYQILCSQVS